MITKRNKKINKLLQKMQKEIISMYQKYKKLQM